MYDFKITPFKITKEDLEYIYIYIYITVMLSILIWTG